MGDRTWTEMRAGRCARLAQYQPRLRAGGHAFRALHSDPELPRCGRRVPGCGTGRRHERDPVASAGPALPLLLFRVDTDSSAGRIGHAAVHGGRSETPRRLAVRSDGDQPAFAAERPYVLEHAVERLLQRLTG